SPNDDGADLRASIAATVALLSEEERSALLAISTFRGGFDLDAAEAAIGEASAWPLDLLESLHDHSLLLIDEEPAGKRYRLLLCVRELAAEELELRSELRRAAFERHARHYVERGETCLAAGGEALRAFSRERDNLAAAVDRAGSLEPPLVLRAA